MKTLFGRFGQGALTILSLVLLAPAQRADADAVFSGVADATLTLTGLTGVPASSILAIPFTAQADSNSTTVAQATATSAALATTTFVPPNPVVGNSTIMTTSVSGTVPAPAIGSASAVGITAAGLTLVNLGTATATLTFTFDYRYFISASTDTNFELANADATITLTAVESVGGTIVNFALNPSVAAANGSSQTDSSATYPSFLTIPFTLTLSPFESASINLRAETSGLAVRAVPEPSSLALCGLFGASVLATLYRRRRLNLT